MQQALSQQKKAWESWKVQITFSFFRTAHIFQMNRSKQTLLAPWCAILPIKHSHWWGLQCLGDASSDSQSCAFALWHQDTANSAKSSGYKSSSKSPRERGDSFQAEISSGYESRRKKQQKKKPKSLQAAQIFRTLCILLTVRGRAESLETGRCGISISQRAED